MELRMRFSVGFFPPSEKGRVERRVMPVIGSFRVGRMIMIEVWLKQV